MFISEKELDEKIKRKLRTLVFDKEWIAKTQDTLVNNYGLDLGAVFPYLTLKEQPAAWSLPIKRVICLELFSEDELNKIFTPEEINKIQNTIFDNERDSIKFPLVFRPVIKIREDQYSTKITGREIIKYLNANLLRYNEMMQRTMKVVTIAGTKYYQQVINPNAVNNMEKLFTNKEFIPNTLTFNAPEYATLNYDEETYTLTIDDIDAFDITDGYNRIVALRRACEKNEELDYVMELRITTFSINKARQFIHQEDQKTHMKKVDSRSFDQSNYGNQVSQMLSRDELADIVKYNGIIPFARLSNVINVIWFNNKDISYKKSYLVNIRNKIFDGITKLLYENPDLFDTIWDRYEVAAAIYLISIDQLNEKNFVSLSKEIEKNYPKRSEGIYTKRDITRISKIFKGEG